MMGLASGTGLDFGRSFEAQWETMGRQMREWMGQGATPFPRNQGQSLDYLHHAMQAFDSVWDAMRQNMTQAQQMAAGASKVRPLPSKGAAGKAHH